MSHGHESEAQLLTPLSTAFADVHGAFVLSILSSWPLHLQSLGSKALKSLSYSHPTSNLSADLVGSKYILSPTTLNHLPCRHPNPNHYHKQPGIFKQPGLLN